MANMVIKGLIPMLRADQGGRSILIFGDSGDGKTAQIGELAEHLYTFGKSPKGEPLKTRLCTADMGGIDVIRPYIELGIIEVLDLCGRPDPWEWQNNITKGMVPDATGRWVPGIRPDIGMYAFEGFTSMGNAMRVALSGGDLNLDRKPSQGGDKDAHGRNFGLTQDRVKEIANQSFKLPGIKIWTALARRGDDNDTNQTILGPQIVGKALTSEVPQWFNFTFRISCVPGDELTKTPEKHRLYLGDFVDQASRGAKGLGNNRKPLDGGELPAYVEPASLVQALALIDAATPVAAETIRARLRAAGHLPV